MITVRSAHSGIKKTRDEPPLLVHLPLLRLCQLHKKHPEPLTHCLHVPLPLLRRRGPGIPDPRVVRHLPPMPRRPGPAFPEPLDTEVTRSTRPRVGQRSHQLGRRGSIPPGPSPPAWTPRSGEDGVGATPLFQVTV